MTSIKTPAFLPGYLERLFSPAPKEGLAAPMQSPRYADSSLAFLESIHRRRSDALKEIIAAQGWPSAFAMGDHAEAAAFMIAHHADYEPALQKQCHKLMLESAKRGETTNLGFLAFLTDRILCNDGHHQRFGTQLREVTNGCFVPKPIEDPDEVDRLREETQLHETLSEYLQRVNDGDMLFVRRVMGGFAEELEHAKEHKVLEFPGKPN